MRSLRNPLPRGTDRAYASRKHGLVVALTAITTLLACQAADSPTCERLDGGERDGGGWIVTTRGCVGDDVGVHDVGTDAVDLRCTNEGHYDCDFGGHVCCAGYRLSFSDGPCGFRPDGGPVDAGAGFDASPCVLAPFGAGCACAEAGAEHCTGVISVCTDGAWAPSDRVCDGFCDLFH